MVNAEDKKDGIRQKALALLPSLLAEHREEVRARRFGDRLLPLEFRAVAGEAAERALPENRDTLSVLAAAFDVSAADQAGGGGPAPSAFVDALRDRILECMEEDLEQAYASQFEGTGPDDLAALAGEAVESARSSAKMRGHETNTDSFEAAFDAWRRGEPESFGEFVREALKLIASLAQEDIVSFRSAGRRFKEALYFAMSRPERFERMTGRAPGPAI